MAKKRKKAAKRKTKRRSGSITVTLARLSQDVEQVVIARGGTLRDALLKAGFAAGDLAPMLEGVRVNGRTAPLKLTLKQGDFITVAPRVQGG